MTPEELLMPRYKVIADYPNSPFSGILTLKKYWDGVKYEWYGHDGLYSEYDSFFKGYPHLFKPLEWWEEREIEDMPKYVKLEKDYMETKVGVYEVEKIDNDNSIGCSMIWINQRGLPIGHSKLKIAPATKEEYETYLKSLTSPNE